MKLKIFTVFDSAAGAFLQPFFMQARGQAIRTFSDAVNNPEHQFYKHPQDYTLFYLGEFDDEHGTFDGQAPESLGNAVQFEIENGRELSAGYRESVGLPDLKPAE